MDNSRFSSLIYRIIGKPERWHDDYIDVMHQIIDETDSFDDPANFSELAVGEQILSRIQGTNEALAAFCALLNKSRFKMIILDEALNPIYHNDNASELHRQLLASSKSTALQAGLILKIKAALTNPQKRTSLQPVESLISLDYPCPQGDHLYLRTLHGQPNTHQPATFHLLMALDDASEQTALNPELVSLYELTEKEQMVLRHLIHGKNIKEIASLSFITENTVRTHIKALFRKTNTNSQTDIVRLMLTHESQVLDSYFTTNPGLITQPLSISEDRTITLSNGYTITYREYGPADGHPIIVCHNGYGCRISIPHNHAEVCAKTNRRIIIPDRPGFGKTPYLPDHPQNWNAYLNEFIEALKLTSYDILGNVLGTPIALCFAAQADQRLRQVILTSPVFVNKKDDIKQLTGILAPSSRLVKASKKFAKEIYELWLKSVNMNLSTHYRSMLDTSLGDAERELFKQHGTLDLMVDGFKEGCSIGIEGISNEMVYCLSPRKLDLSKLKIPVTLWWGTQDNRISREGVEKLAKQLPNSTVHIKEGYSEHIYYALFEEIIS